MCRPLLNITAGLFVALLIFDIVWLQTIKPFSVSMPDLIILGKALCVLAGAFITAHIVQLRIADDNGSIAKKLFYVANSTKLMSLSGGFMIAVSAMMAIANYLLMTTALPLQDDLFARFDQGLGFDWVAMLEWFEHRSKLSWILVTAYSTSLMQMMAVIFIFSATGRGDRLLEFAALYTITGIIVGFVAMLLPGLGAHAYHQPRPELYDQFSNLGYVHLTTLEQLRNGTFELLEMKNTVGMVTFPSFHTVLAILVTYAFRDYRIVFVPIALLNILVIVSTLPEGGHYLVDLFGGAAIAVGAIFFVRAFNSKKDEFFHEETFSLTT